MSDDVSKTPRSKKITVKSAHVINRRLSPKWVIKVIVITFLLSVLISLATTSLLNDVSILIAIFILLIIVSLGIFFDVIGIAATAAKEAPFHAMASNRVYGAQCTITLVRNAEKVSNICNDVIGDICGIISGATATAIIAELYINKSTNSIIISLVLTGAVAALTVGGKAAGKTIAISHCNEIMYAVGKMLCFFSKGNNGRK